MRETIAVTPASSMPLDFSIRLATNDDIPAIRAILFAVRSEYGVLGEIGANDADLDDIEQNYFRVGGCFEVVEDAAGRIVGCAGLYPLNPCRVELCKMYLEKSARGRGLGKRLLEDLLKAARSGAFREVWLKTNSVLTEAIALYKSVDLRPPSRSISRRDATPPTCCVWTETQRCPCRAERPYPVRPRPHWPKQPPQRFPQRHAKGSGLQRACLTFPGLLVSLRIGRSVRVRVASRMGNRGELSRV